MTARLNRKIVTLSEDEMEWIEENDIHFGKFMRRAIKRAMNMESD